MAMRYSQTNSGLVLAHAGGDEAAVGRALWEYDRSLKLKSSTDAGGRTWWSVRAHVGGDTPDRFVCAWMDDNGDPLPLSMGVLDLVKQLDPNTRSRYLTEDERDAEMRAGKARQDERDREALASDWSDDKARPILPRSQSLRMSRDRRRGRGEKV